MRVFTLRNAAGATTPFYLLPGLEIEISAIGDPGTGERGEWIDFAPGHELLPDAVCDYIAAHGLYRLS